MDSNISENLFETINNIYNRRTFLEKYGLDIWTAVIICLVFFVITFYFYVMNNVKPIISDWNNQKCNPTVIPFAGLINKGPNDTAFDFTSKNFTGCIQSTLTNIVAYSFQPIYYTVKTLTDNFSSSNNSVNSIRSMINKIRNSIKDFSKETMNRTLNITVPIIEMFIAIKSMGAKMTGTLTASLFTLIGSYLTLQSMFAMILEFITVILFIIAGTIAGLIIISFIPIFGSWAIPIVAVDIAIMIAILIPTIMIQMFMSDVLSLSSRSLPSVPSCFRGTTMISVQNKIDTSIYNKTPIENVEIGDILKNGEIVTAVMKFSSNEQTMWNINGIYVTGEHRVFHKSLGWIHVKEHPNRIYIPDFREPFVYCIGTDTKTFTIENNEGDNILFSDWDDIDEHLMKYLSERCKSVYNKPDIHKHLDNGIIGTSLVELKNDNKKQIRDVQINDILANGEKVLGIIKIDAVNLNKLQDYKVDGKNIIGVNINICSRKETIRKDMSDILIKEKYLYHLLTKSGTFRVNGIPIRDYNYGIDKYTI